MSQALIDKISSFGEEEQSGDTSRIKKKIFISYNSEEWKPEKNKDVQAEHYQALYAQEKLAATLKIAQDAILQHIYITNTSGIILQQRIGRVSRLLDSTECLNQLARNNLSNEEENKLIIKLDGLEIPESEKSKLINLLAEYIEENRDNNDIKVLAIVGSAIRKLVANISSADYSVIAQILESGHKATLTPVLELEILKSVVFRLTRNVLDLDVIREQLQEPIWEMAQAYLNDRFLSRDYDGVIGLNATLALVFLRSNYTLELVELFRKIKTNWFRQLVVRRIGHIKKMIISSDSGVSEQIEDLFGTVDEFVSNIQVIGS